MVSDYIINIRFMIKIVITGSDKFTCFFSNSACAPFKNRFLALDPSQEEVPEFFVGIDVAYDDLDEIKGLIDEVSPYTNFFVIGCTGISYNKSFAVRSS